MSTEHDPLEQIRAAYGVPAYLGAEVLWEGPLAGSIRGRIEGAQGAWLLVRLDDPLRREPVTLHPVHKIRYLGAEPEAAGQMDLFGNPNPKEGT